MWQKFHVIFSRKIFKKIKLPLGAELQKKNWLLKFASAQASKFRVFPWVLLFVFQNDLGNALTMQEVDNSNGVLFPLYDPDTNMIYLCGKVSTYIHIFPCSLWKYTHFISMASNFFLLVFFCMYFKDWIEVSQNFTQQFYWNAVRHILLSLYNHTLFYRKLWILYRILQL